MAAKKFKVLNGINYTVKGEDKRREIGDIVSDIPPKSLAIYLRKDSVEPYDGDPVTPDADDDADDEED